MMNSLVNHIAGAFEAAENCQRSDNAEWQAKHVAAIDALVREHMPSGSGFDNGTRLNFNLSGPDKLVFETDFHHMNEHGVYECWTQHRVTVRPSFVFGVNVAVNGSNRREIRDYIAETFHEALATPVDSAAAYNPA
jgi:hypothetical protein